VYTPGSNSTDSAFQLPAFNEIWAHVDVANRAAWRAWAAASRTFLQHAAHSTTGLAPDLAGFDGTPLPGTDGQFGVEAYRVALDVAVDHTWFGIDPWQTGECDRLLTFFSGQGIDTYGAGYSLDGLTVTLPYRSPALEAMNGTAALCATVPVRTAFVQAVWNLAVPTGQFRYYDGMLYLMSLLALSGDYRVYVP
jgi:oligosaccharide reducing-end xylanase